MSLTSVLAAVQLRFDPVMFEVGTPWGPFALRWQAVAMTLTVLIALLVAERFASRSGARRGLPPLHLNDLLYLAIAVMTGAFIGGRIVHGIDYLDVYARDPAALFDISRGSLSLLGAVLGGTLSGAYMAAVLRGSVWRWADAAAIPMLIAIGLGKVAQLLGGGGQGNTFDGPWAVSFVGDGPWQSLSPATAAHPAQLYEGLWALLAVPVLAIAYVQAQRATTGDGEGESARGVVARDPLAPRGAPDEPRRRRGSAARATEGAEGRFGDLFLVALCWWLAGRFLVGFAWKDEQMLGPLRVEQALAMAAVIVIGALYPILIQRCQPTAAGVEPRPVGAEQPPVGVPAPAAPAAPAYEMPTPASGGRGSSGGASSGS